MMNINEVMEEVLMDCKPYLVHWRRIEDLIKSIIKESEDVLTICSKLEVLASKEEDPTLKTDLRILVSRLKSLINLRLRDNIT